MGAARKGKVVVVVVLWWVLSGVKGRLAMWRAVGVEASVGDGHLATLWGDDEMADRGNLFFSTQACLRLPHSRPSRPDIIGYHASPVIPNPDMNGA